MRLSFLLPLLLGAALVTVACTPAAPAPVTPQAPQGSPTVAAPPPTAPPAAGPAVTLTLASGGNEARYRVNETLANQKVADAVGSTNGLSGKLVFSADGSVSSAQSSIAVDVKSLQSDRNSRDKYLKSNVLETDQFPTVNFVPTKVTGLTFPLPASGDVAFQMAGDLTVRTVTKPVTWQIQATMAGRDASGKATTTFTFADFDLEKPNVLAVLSVEDDIRLELDFNVSQTPG